MFKASRNSMVRYLNSVQHEPTRKNYMTGFWGLFQEVIDTSADMLFCEIV